MSVKTRAANLLANAYRAITGYDFMLIDNPDGTQTEYNFQDRHYDAYFSNAFRACLLAKARPLSTLPVRAYKREDGIRVEATEEFAKAYLDLLRHKWNPFMTGAEGTRWLDMTKDILGNAFARVEFNTFGYPCAIYPLTSQPTVCVTSDGHAIFKYGGDTFTPAGTYLENEIIWVKSPVLDSDYIHGKSLATLAAAEVNLSIELTEFYTNMINGEAPTAGWLETDNPLTDQVFQRIQTQLSDHKGVVNSGKVRIFDHGLHYKYSKDSVVDLNVVEQEKWILQETCRTLSVPPQEVFELSNATYSNIEQGALNFANKTLVPECVTIEQGYSSILWANGYADLNIQLDMNGLLRGSYKERMDGYRIAIYGSFMSPNEVRAKEDMAPYDGGDRYFVSAAYGLLDPTTGDIETISGNDSQPQAGGSGESGEGGRGNSGENNPSGMALAVVHKDMQDRVHDRYLSTGDTPKFRDFAAKVLAPIKQAFELVGEEYTIDDDIDEIIKE